MQQNDGEDSTCRDRWLTGEQRLRAIRRIFITDWIMTVLGRDIGARGRGVLLKVGAHACPFAAGRVATVALGVIPHRELLGAVSSPNPEVLEYTIPPVPGKVGKNLIN